MPNLARLKHFGAAASSSGGVEMYHLVGVTPEAPSARGGLRRQRGRRDAALRRGGTPRHLGAHQRDRQATRKVDYVMLGCPHYTIEQIWEAARLLEGRKVHPDCELWIFTPRAIKHWPTRTATRRSSRTPAGA